MCVLTLSGDECVCVISYFNLCDWVLLVMLQGGIYICFCLAVCDNEADADMLIFFLYVM